MASVTTRFQVVSAGGRAPRSTWRSRCRATPDDAARHAPRLTPATCGGRTRSSTASTSRRTWTRDGDGVGDFRGLIEQVDYLAGLGVTCLWLMPFYPTPEPRRRLRHQRLLRRRPAARHPRRLRRVRAHRERPRDPRDRRPRRQPHVRRAPVVPEPRASSRDSPLPRLVRLARRAVGRARRASRSPTRRRATGSYDRRSRRSTTCTASTASSPTSTSPTRPCATRSQDRRRSGSRSGCRASAMDAVPVPARARRHRASTWTATRRAGCATLRVVRRPPQRRGACCSARSTPTLKELSSYFGGDDGDALHMQFDFLLNQSAVAVARARRGRAARGGDPLAARRPARQRVGDLPAQPRRADARQAHRQPSARRSSPRSGPKPGMQLYGHGLRRRIGVDARRRRRRGCGWRGA